LQRRPPEAILRAEETPVSDRETREAIEAGRRFLKANWHLRREAETDQDRGVPVPAQQKSVPAEARLVGLVPPEEFRLGTMPVVDALRRRRSRRQFGPGALTREELSFLLWATQGVRKRAPKYSLRTVPSGGARHAFETYLFVARVDDVARGLYRYRPLDHDLVLLSEALDLSSRLDEALMGQLWDAAAVFAWTAVPYRMEWRYSLVSHKIIALDAGHLCQNLYIACEAIGCGTCGIGAYDQNAMDGFLGVDGRDEFTIYAAPVGRRRE
jgi:SagB-type dehydrogenase family enzyme